MVAGRGVAAARGGAGVRVVRRRFVVFSDHALLRDRPDAHTHHPAATVVHDALGKGGRERGRAGDDDRSSSLTCSHCGDFHVATLPLLKSTYVDTGRLSTSSVISP